MKESMVCHVPFICTAVNIIKLYMCIKGIFQNFLSYLRLLIEIIISAYLPVARKEQTPTYDGKWVLRKFYSTKALLQSFS